MNVHIVRAERLAETRSIARSNLVERRLRRYRPELQMAVRALARRHTRFADLAVSFPALLVGLAVPRAGVDLRPAMAKVVAGYPLGEIAAGAKVPVWLRRLPPEAFAGAIPRLPDHADFRRRIANHLPRSPKLAPLWLEAVAVTAECAHEGLAIWIARELTRSAKDVGMSRLRLISLWAWFSGRPGTRAHGLIENAWSPQMGANTAMTNAFKWRQNVDLLANLGETPIDDMWTQPAIVDGFEFVPLRSFSDVADEARAMRNCIHGYGFNLVHNRTRFWSVRKDGRRIATLEVASGHEPLPNIYELRAADNKDAPVDVWWAARRWLHAHDLPRVNANCVAWGGAPLNKAAWRALWKPYWIAKRRIPAWLPLTPSRDALDAL